MATARVGAPPVRETTDGSPTSSATCLRASAPSKVFSLPCLSHDSHRGSIFSPFVVVTPRLRTAWDVMTSRSLVDCVTEVPASWSTLASGVFMPK